MTGTKAKKPRAKKVEAVAPEQTIVAFKGFTKDLTCTGGDKPFQYEIGKEYLHDGDVRACRSGFHACENPWDVLSYYPLIASDGSFNRFCRVTLGGQIERHSDDSKIAAGKIVLDVELSLPDFVAASVKWIIDATKLVVSAAKGGEALNDNGKDDARIGSSGYGARIGSSGNDARIGSSGNGAQIGSSGNGAQIGSSGNGAQIVSSGYGAQIVSSGYGAQIGSSGNGAQIGSSGNGARIDSTGERAVIAAAGVNVMVKGKDGAWLALAEYTWNAGEARYDCIGFATGCIGTDGLKADTFYRAQGGKLVEVA